MHGCNREFGNISFLSTLTLNNNCIIALIIIVFLACILIMINNDAQTLANSFSGEEAASRTEKRLLGDLCTTFLSSTARIFAEAAIHLGCFTGLGSK